MKRNVCKLLGVFAAAALVLSGCGSQPEVVEGPSEPAVEETADTESESAEDEAVAKDSAEPVEEDLTGEYDEPAEDEVQEAEEPAVNEPATYEDANGWSLKYYENFFEINHENGMVSFVYTGESAGTNMLTVSYEVETTDPEEVVDKLVKEWGDTAVKSEGTFPGTESVPCFRASLPVSTDGSGLYMEAIVRSYMQGCLVFELTGHNSGDDELDMAVSDNMAMLIDSVEFAQYMDSDADHAMTTDIEGCDTFTQIVDKLPAGAGYANAKAGDEDVLLVASGTFDNGDGNFAAIDAEVFYYKDGAPAYAGYVTAGGTAYPLSVKDDMLYVGSNRSMQKYVIKDGKVFAKEWAAVQYDEDSSEHYSYSLDDGNDYSGLDEKEAKQHYTALFDEFESAEPIVFDTIK